MPRQVWYKLVVRRQSVDQFSIVVNQQDCGLCAEFHIIEEFALTGRESLTPRTGLLSRSHVFPLYFPPASLPYLPYLPYLPFSSKHDINKLPRSPHRREPVSS